MHIYYIDNRLRLDFRFLEETKMKKIVCASLAVLLVGGGLGLMSAKEAPMLETKAETMEVTRVFAYLKGGWDSDGSMYAYVYASGVEGENYNAAWPGVKMTRVLEDYWQGLYYYDIPADLDYTHVVFSSGQQDWKNSNKARDIALTEFVGSEGYYVAAGIEAWVADDTPREVTFGGVGISVYQAAATFSAAHVDVCNDYALYPVYRDLFITPSAGWEEATENEEDTRYTVNVESNEYGGTTTFTLDEVLNQFEAQYNNHTLAPTARFIFKEDYLSAVIICAIVLGVALIGIIPLTMKRKTAR